MAMMTREEFLQSFPAFFKDYQPSQESLARISNVCLLIVVGPSGVGKSSVIDRLGLKYVPIDVTRARRPEEQEGVDMFFRQDYDQLLTEIKSAKFLQFVVGVSGDFYGTRASSYPSGGWAVMPILADVVPSFRRMGFKQTLSVFITPPSYEEWMRRLKHHPITEGQLARRLDEAKRSLEFSLNDNQMHFILNDDLDAAVDQAKGLLAGKIDSRREARAKEIARDLLTRLP